MNNKINYNDMKLDKNNLYYFTGNNAIEKETMLQCVSVILHNLQVPVSNIAEWLRISKNDVNIFITRGMSHLYEWNSKQQIANANTVAKNVSWFLKHQHPVFMNNKSLDYIIELLLSNITSYQIAKDTGISQPTITYLREGKRQISHLKMDTAKKLIDYYKEKKQWISWSGLLKSISNYINYHLQGYGINPHHPNIITATFVFSSINTMNTKFGKELRISFNKRKPVWKSSQKSMPAIIRKLCNRYAKMPAKRYSANDTTYMVHDLESKKKQIKKLYI